MPDFHEIRFPLEISWGAVGGPSFFTTIGATQSGVEKRNQNWSIERRRWDVTHALKTQQDVDELLTFFLARKGRAFGFRFRDWNDYCTDMTHLVGTGFGSAEPNPDTLPAVGVLTPIKAYRLGTTTNVGDSTTRDFQLVKEYLDSINPYARVIKKPVSSVATPLRMFKNGVATTAFTIDLTTGIVTFNVAPTGAESVTWEGYFDVPVRFESDDMQLQMQETNVNEWGPITVIELRL